MEASYRVKIEGYLIDEYDDACGNYHTAGGFVAVSPESDKMGHAMKQTPSDVKNARPRLSHFFKALSVDFDRSRFRNGAEQSIEWKKPDSIQKNQNSGNMPLAADFDKLTFKRNGDENTNITINLYRHESPERYRLSPELEKVVDMAEATQQEAVMGLWEYIRFRGLQEDEEKRDFRCDELLRRVSQQRRATTGHRIGSLQSWLGCWQRRRRLHSHAQRVCDAASPASSSREPSLHY